MNIREIRQAKMLSLIKDFRTQAEFAEKIETDPAYISQIKSGVKKDGSLISMGDDVARRIERKLNLPNGYMDTIENQKVKNINTGKSSSMIKIPKYEAKIACGNGYTNGDFPEQDGHVELSEDFLLSLGLPANGDGLILAPASGESMSPRISDNDLLLINRKEVTFDELINGKVYAFNWGGDMICKTAYREGNNMIVLRSQNKDKETYPDRTIKREDMEDISLFGRVRYVFLEL